LTFYGQFSFIFLEVVLLQVLQLLCSKFSTLIIHAHSIVNVLRQSVSQCSETVSHIDSFLEVTVVGSATASKSSTSRALHIHSGSCVNKNKTRIQE
jgi:ABC-type polysaccharide transport system permease subunit